MALAVMCAAVVTATTGCLVIGNRGGLGDDEKKMLREIKEQIHETDARLFRLEREAGLAHEPEPRMEELERENDRLRQILNEHEIKY